MATLRCAQTSETLAQGTPAEMVLLADKIGRDEILFDDVGLGFDPDAALAAHREQVDSYAALASSTAKDVDAETRKRAKAHVADAKKAEAALPVSDAKAALKAARDRVAQASARG